MTAPARAILRALGDLGGSCLVGERKMENKNLLALLLQRRLQVAGASDRISPGRYRVSAGEMSAVIEATADGPPRVFADDGRFCDCTVKGGMRSLLAVLVGEMGVMRAALTGKVRAGGKIWKLLSLLRLARRGPP